MPGRVLVAPRKPAGRNKLGCLVCKLPTTTLQFVNAAIWDGSEVRVRSYRERGREAYLIATGDEIEVKTITSHADHVERSWHEVTTDRPERSNEVPVFPGDYESLVDTAASLSVKAMQKLEAKIENGELGDRELLGAAKMGVVARAQQESNRIAAKNPAITLTAIFGLASGHLTSLPESEVIDVTPERELLDEVRQEKALLTAHARGADPG